MSPFKLLIQGALLVGAVAVSWQMWVFLNADKDYAIGKSALEARQFGPAMQYLNRSIKANPWNGSALFSLGSAFIQRNSQDYTALLETRRFFNRVMTFVPIEREEPLAPLPDIPEELRAAFPLLTEAEDLVQLRPIVFHRGLVEEWQGRWANALDHYEQAYCVSVLPEEKQTYRRRISECLIDLAVEALQRGDRVSALGHVRRAYDIAPGRSVVLEALGAVLFLSGNTDEAVPHLEQALALEPNSYIAALVLARIHVAAGRLGEATPLLERAYLTPYTESTLMLDRVLGEALAVYQSTNEPPTTPSPRAMAAFLAARIYLDADQNEAAATLLDGLRMPLDENPHYWFERGRLALRQEERVKARVYLLNCVGKLPNHAGALRLLARMER